MGQQGTSSDTERSAQGAARLRWLIPLGVFALVLAREIFWLKGDHSMPMGDAGGHALVATRYLDLLKGAARFPMEQYPPLGHLSIAAAMWLLGGSLFAAKLGVTAWLAVLASGASALGLRMQGRFAAVLAPALVLAVPFVVNISHDLLLDGPVLATVPWVLLFLWECRGFTRLWPALGLGLSIAVGVLIKYTFMLWLLPAVALAGLRTLVRAPLALLPAALSCLPAAWVLTRIWARRPAPNSPQRYNWHWPPDLGKATAVLALSLLATLIVRQLVERHRRRKGEAEPGGPTDLSGALLRGLTLGVALNLAFCLTLPWFYGAATAFLSKLLDEAVDHPKVAGWDAASTFVRLMVWRSWTRAFEWSAAGAALAALTTLVVATGAWRHRLVGKLTGDLGHLRWGTVAEITLGIVGCVAFGSWLHSRILPTDARYYFYVPALLALLTALGVSWLRATRWTLGPLLLAIALAQYLYSPTWWQAWGPDWLVPAVQISPTVQYSRSEKAPFQIYAARPQQRFDLVTPIDRMIEVVKSRLPEGWRRKPPCSSVGLMADRTEKLETDSLTGYMAMRELDLCLFFPLERLLPRAATMDRMGPTAKDKARAKLDITTVVYAQVGGKLETTVDELNVAFGRQVEVLETLPLEGLTLYVMAVPPPLNAEQAPTPDPGADPMPDRRPLGSPDPRGR